MQEYVKKDALKRLATARGHLDHVISAVKAEKYCTDILQQSLAVQSALRAVDNIILKGHLEEHAIHALQGRNKGVAIKEIIDVFNKARR